MDRPAERPLSALPSPAPASPPSSAILLGGLAGGLIGYSWSTLQCERRLRPRPGPRHAIGAVAARRRDERSSAVLVLRALGRVARDRGSPAPVSPPTTTGPRSPTLRALASDLASRRATPRSRPAQSASAASAPSRRPPTWSPSSIGPPSALIVGGSRDGPPDDGIVGEEGTDTAGTSGVDWLDRPDRRHHQLRVRAAAWYDVRRRRRRRRDARRRGVRARRSTSCSRRPAAAARRSTGTRSAVSRPRRLAAGAGRHRVQLPRPNAAASRPPARGDDRRRPRHPSARRGRASTCATWPCGRLDAYFEEPASTAGTCAAGELIAREAGCRSRRLRRRTGSPGELLVATPAICSTTCSASSLPATADADVVSDAAGSSRRSGIMGTWVPAS